MHSPAPKSPFREKILLVDDVPANLGVLSTTLEAENYEVLVAPDGSTALKLAAKAQPSLILLDVLMPGWDGVETCRQLKALQETRDIPVIFITARNETNDIVAGFRAGGVDYIVKPFQAEEVVTRVATHLTISRLNRQLVEKNRMLEARTAELTAEMERRSQAEAALRHADEKLAAFSDMEASRGNLSGLVGASPSIRHLTEQIRRLHQFPNTSVLLLGESGTGKELVARAIHFESSRSRAPFVPVNCVAIPSELAESILFGHVKGAFTGATSDRKGCFELADGGTLFLDEIGDMPPSLQVKLLRVLEDGQVQAVGGSHSVKVDVRVIAATNADLDTNIANGSFRQDLYFRLARYTLTTPPLRGRLEDVPLLASHFLRMFAAEMGIKAPSVSLEACQALQAHPFPGNVREFRNVIERALIESGGGPIDLRHLKLPRTGAAVLPASPTLKQDCVSALPLNIAEAEELLMQRALKETDGNIAEAARLLGIHRTRIYRKLAKEQDTAV
jgi:DNA-binding NtrC family response regulator